MFTFLMALLLAQSVTYPPPDLTALNNQVAAQAQVQQSDVTLDASGNGSWTFSPAFTIVPAVVHLPKAMDNTNPIICNYTAISTTGVTVHCWRTNVSGLLSGLLGGNVAGAQVKLIARAIP